MLHLLNYLIQVGKYYEHLWIKWFNLTSVHNIFNYRWLSIIIIMIEKSTVNHRPIWLYLWLTTQVLLSYIHYMASRIIVKRNTEYATYGRKLFYLYNNMSTVWNFEWLNLDTSIVSCGHFNYFQLNCFIIVVDSPLL